jgi:hypothetical protein
MSRARPNDVLFVFLIAPSMSGGVIGGWTGRIAAYSNRSSPASRSVGDKFLCEPLSSLEKPACNWEATFEELIQGRIEFVMRNSRSCDKSRWLWCFVTMGWGVAVAIHGDLIPIIRCFSNPNLHSLLGFTSHVQWLQKINREINRYIISITLNDIVATISDPTYYLSLSRWA